jgi:pimeloyl-ACP methyl ester carboxylesterase
MGLKKPAIFCHGAGDTASTFNAYIKVGQRAIFDEVAQTYILHAGDLGGAYTFGNQSAVDAVDDAYDYLVSAWGCTGPALLVAGSMGMTVALNYAKRFPTRVKAIAGAIPLTHLTGLYVSGVGQAANIDAAYGGTYDPVLEGALWDPAQFVRNEVSNDLRMKVWYATDDPLVFPVYTTEFLTVLRPQTERQSLGALGHSEAALLAASADIGDWVRSL